MTQMTSYLEHNTISVRETYSESLVKIRHDDVILWHVKSFSNHPTYRPSDVTKVKISEKVEMS
jgi:hypothetical protein